MENQLTGYPRMAEVLTQAQDHIKAAQDDPMQTQTVQGLVAQLQQMKGPILHRAGQADSSTAQSNTFGPMTDLAAHGIVPVETDDAPVLINPEAEDTAALQAKVDELYPQWESLSPEVLADYAKAPNGALVIRTIFRRAGVPDYETAPINLATIEAVTKFKVGLAEAQAKQAEVDAKLTKLKPAKAL